MSIDRDGNLLVSDSHYFCVRVYSPEGVELRSFGPDSGVPDGLSYISDTVQDEDGNYYIAEFGDHHRITKLGSLGSFPEMLGHGRHGARGVRPHPTFALARIGICTRSMPPITAFRFTRAMARRSRTIGEPGDQPGQFSYPYDMDFNAAGEFYVIEHGNNRVQKFSKDGKSIGMWGTPGRKPGCLHEPWALAVDSRGCVHLVDTENHRVQRIRF